MSKNELKATARALAKLSLLKESGHKVIDSSMLSRSHRERLKTSGYIKEVVRGMYICSSPADRSGSIAWSATYWQFVERYLGKRFDTSYCLYAEQSLSLHIEEFSIPKELLVRSPRGRNKSTKFINETSVSDRNLALPSASYMTKISDINVYTLAASLVFLPAEYFKTHAKRVKTAIHAKESTSAIIAILTKEKKTVAAGRIAGAYREAGKDKDADLIISKMRAAGFNAKEMDPFSD